MMKAPLGERVWHLTLTLLQRLPVIQTLKWFVTQLFTAPHKYLPSDESHL